MRSGSASRVGNHYYWHNIQKLLLSKVQRPRVGRNIMVWDGISAFGNVGLVIVPSNENLQKYLGILWDKLLPFLEKHKNINLIFQQDNARVHTTHMARGWFQENNVAVLPWPTNSPE